MLKLAIKHIAKTHTFLGWKLIFSSVAMPSRAVPDLPGQLGETVFITKPLLASLMRLQKTQEWGFAPMAPTTPPTYHAEDGILASACLQPRIAPNDLRGLSEFRTNKNLLKPSKQKTNLRRIS
jgi:hypothetical protein